MAKKKIVQKISIEVDYANWFQAGVWTEIISATLAVLQNAVLSSNQDNRFEYKNKITIDWKAVTLDQLQNL